MALTGFGKTMRKARIDTGHTLLTMADALDTTPAYLSAFENGKRKISKKWIEKIALFFKNEGLDLGNLETLANVSNDIVPIDGLSEQHKMLVAGFAHCNLSQDEIEEITKTLKNMGLLNETND